MRHLPKSLFGSGPAVSTWRHDRNNGRFSFAGASPIYLVTHGPCLWCCGAANYDEEAAQEAGYMAGFQDKAVRQGFTRKVLGIVATQLIITMLFSIAFYYSAPLKVSRRAAGLSQT